MKIAIYGSRRQQPFLKPIQAFLTNLRKSGVGVIMHRKLYDHLGEIAPQLLEGVECAASPFGADIAVSLGGDGTFLRTAQWLGSLEIPVVGVNTGHLGYLAALTIDELPKLLEYISTDRFSIERRSVLRVEEPSLPGFVGQFALNEVALSKEESASMIMAQVDVDGELLADYRADGLILCTSTGSTAYNLSVGGPIVQPTLDVCVISPVAAHSLSMRPLVLDAASTIAITPSGRSPHVRIALDGRSAQIPTGTRIVISQAPFKLQVLQLADHGFAQTLRLKLHWGEQ